VVIDASPLGYTNAFPLGSADMFVIKSPFTKVVAISLVVSDVSFAQLQEVIVVTRRIVKIVIIVFFIVLFLVTLN
jgi:hypothetical protein